MSLSPIENAVDAFRNGRMVAVVDDERRENEGDLFMAAEFVTAEHVAFFLHHTSGYICVAALPDRLEELEIPMMVTNNTESHRTAFTITVDAREGTTTGISAHDRALTVRALADSSTTPFDLRRPGHIQVLKARVGGVLKRPGHTEAAVDLARLARVEPVTMICEIVTEDKLQMARVPELRVFAAEHDIPLISIADLIEYCRSSHSAVSA